MILLITGSIACINSFGPKTVVLSELGNHPISEGEQIHITNAQITSPITQDGFFIADAMGDVSSALWVEYVENAPENVAMGDVIEIQGRFETEVFTTTQNRLHIINRLEVYNHHHVVVDARHRMISPSIYQMTELNNPDLLFDLESAFVRIENATVINEDDRLMMGKMIIDETYHVVGSKFSRASFKAIQGIVSTQSGEPSILPRIEDDLIGMHSTCSAQRCLSDLQIGE